MAVLCLLVTMQARIVEPSADQDMSRSLYDILGLEPSATERDIRVAYKRLAKKWHPDKNPDNVKEAEEKFKEMCSVLAIGCVYPLLHSRIANVPIDPVGI
jgi:preprotein translocase subunit Sec63